MINICVRILRYPVWQLLCLVLFIHHVIKIISEDYNENDFYDDVLRCRVNLETATILIYSYLAISVAFLHS